MMLYRLFDFLLKLTADFTFKLTLDFEFNKNCEPNI